MVWGIYRSPILIGKTSVISSNIITSLILNAMPSFCVGSHSILLMSCKHKFASGTPAIESNLFLISLLGI